MVGQEACLNPNIKRICNIFVSQLLMIISSVHLVYVLHDLRLLLSPEHKDTACYIDVHLS